MTASEIKAKQIIDSFADTPDDKFRLQQFLASFKSSVIKENTEAIAKAARQQQLALESDGKIVKEMDTYCREIL